MLLISIGQKPYEKSVMSYLEISLLSVRAMVLVFVGVCESVNVHCTSHLATTVVTAIKLNREMLSVVLMIKATKGKNTVYSNTTTYKLDVRAF